MKSLGKMAIASKHFYKDVLETCVPISQESNTQISWKATKWFLSTECQSWSATISLLTESKAIVIVWFNTVQNLLRRPFKLKFAPVKKKKKK